MARYNGKLSSYSSMIVTRCRRSAGAPAATREESSTTAMYCGRQPRPLLSKGGSMENEYLMSAHQRCTKHSARRLPSTLHPFFSQWKDIGHPQGPSPSVSSGTRLRVFLQLQHVLCGLLDGATGGACLSGQFEEGHGDWHPSFPLFFTSDGGESLSPS